MDSEDRIVTLLGDIADELSETEFSSVKHFVYDYLNFSEVERCENEKNARFKLLLQMFKRMTECDTMIYWLKDVFYHLDLNSVLKKIVKYEVEEHKLTKPFTVMLYDVSRQMSEDEFDKLKCYYTALVGSPGLDQAHNVFELFRILKQGGQLDENNLKSFKEKLGQLKNKRMVKIVEQYEKHFNKAEKARGGKPAFQMRPPNVKQVEQNYDARQAGPRFPHPPVSNNWSNVPFQCTEHPSTSLLYDTCQQQITPSSSLGINYIKSMTSEEPVRNQSETVGRRSESNTASVAAQVACIHPWSTSPTRQKDQDHTEPKAHLSDDTSQTVGNQTVAMPDLNLCIGDEQTESFSMERKEIDESTQVKCIADNGDSMKKLKAAINDSMLQQATCHNTEQWKKLLRNIVSEHSGVASSVGGMGGMQLAAAFGHNCTNDDKKDLMPNKDHKDETVPMKKTSNQLHVDSPIMKSTSNLNRENTGLISPITRKDQHLTTGNDKELVGNHGLTEGRQEIKSILKKLHPSIKLYNYQMELAAQALDGYNCIICAPTGSGKALTAAYVCYVKHHEALDEGRPFKALFIVCMRNLIKERKEELLKVFTSGENGSEIVSGMSESARLSGMLQQHDVVVLTAQVLVNALKSKDVDLENIQLLILDECHHTNFGHPYNIIMQEYHRLKLEKRSVPQVVGLTASLGFGEKGDPVEHYIVMCANLHCRSISYVRENLDELLEHNPRPEKDQIISVLPRDPNDMFILIISYLMTETEKLIQHIMTEKPACGSQKYEIWITSIRKEAERKGSEDDVFTCQTLFVYNTALMYCDELATVDVLPLLMQHFNKGNQTSRLSEIKRKVYNLYNTQVKELIEAVAAETLDDNEKLKKLHDLLLDLYSTNPNAKGVLLTRTRFGVEGLVSFIKRHNGTLGLVKCAKFVGQGRGEGLMSDKDQQEVLSRFMLNCTEKDHINLLVATDIAQEGYDLPRCNFVIRYNFVPSEIGLVQSRSLATAKNSECYLIVNRGSVNEIREYENLAKEHAMMEALEKIRQIREEDLMQNIAEQQAKMWRKKEAEEQRKSFLESLCDIKDIVIYCKNCRRMLCYGTDLRKRGPQFVAYSEELEKKVHTSKSPVPAVFRLETHIGSVYCKVRSCNQKLGLHIKYNYGTPNGYALSRNSVVWGKLDSGGYNIIKQWSKVPFSIKEEPLEPLLSK